MEKLLIVDGSNLLFQMFYGMPARILNSRGQAVHGTLGFIGALLKMIRMVRPSHLFVAFDAETENPRRELDGSYKANRPDYSEYAPEDTPFSQLPDIFAALDTLGIRYAETEGCEADDWMAFCAREYGKHMDVVICSQDSDLWQLISPRVRILRYRGKSSVFCDEAWLRLRLDVAPEQYPAHKALTGDHADNIPGVPGVGPKTATALLRQFGTLEALLDHPEQISKNAVRSAVAACRDRLLRNLALIHLGDGVPLPLSLPDLRWQDPGLTTRQVLREADIW